ncbi:MAG TPA: hypothetical protein VIY48_00445 [Candidatus Paceibacterota bacterium]
MAYNYCGEAPMNITETPFKHIWYVREDIKDGDDIYKQGYYFVDETSQLNGPYETLEQTKEELAKYVVHL